MIDYTVSRIPDDDRLKSVRGFYHVVACSEGQSDFAIRETEEEAKEVAARRLSWRMEGWT